MVCSGAVPVQSNQNDVGAAEAGAANASAATAASGKVFFMTGTNARRTGNLRVVSAGALRAAARLEAGDQLVEAQLFEAAADGVELGGAELDELPALLDEVERLAQAGLARVQAADDLLQARGRRLVGALGCGGLVHSSILARTSPSPKNSRTRPASRAPARVVIRLPSPSSTTA